MKSVKGLEGSAAIFRVLGHGVRLRIIEALIDAELSVGDLDALTDTGQPMLSQQLGILRNAGLVKTRRLAKHVFYRLDTVRIGELTRHLERVIGKSVASPVRDNANAPKRGSAAAMFARIVHESS